MAFKFPFTNYHELNLTWVLEQLKKLFEESEENVETIETYDNRLSAVETEVTDLESTTTQAINTANAAATNAATALSRANTANQNALTASSQAGAAVTAAQESKQEAQAATQAAQQAQATAMTFDGRITQAQNDASAAVHEAESFENRVNAAINTANNAANTATIAQGIAVNANQTAAQALDELNAQRDELESIAAGLIDDINDEADAEKQDIQNLADSVIASIPADYTALSNAIIKGNLNQYVKVSPFVIGETVGDLEAIRASAEIIENGAVKLTAQPSGSISSFGCRPKIANLSPELHNSGHKLFIRITNINISNVSNYSKFRVSAVGYNGSSIAGTVNEIVDVSNGINLIITAPEDVYWIFLLAMTNGTPIAGDYITMGSAQVIDLTAMFGAGYEPTKEAFLYVYESGMPYPYTVPEITNNLNDIKALLAGKILDCDIVETNDDIAATTKDYVLVLNNESMYSRGGYLLYKKMSVDSGNGYSRNDGTRVCAVPDQGSLGTSNAPNDLIMPIVKSYIDNDALVYGNEHGLFDNEVTNEFDCSDFVCAVLDGVSYKTSKYVSGNTVNTPIADVTNESVSKDVAPAKLNTRCLAEYFAENKRLFSVYPEPNKDSYRAVRKLQFGDILFFSDDETVTFASSYYHIRHVAFVLMQVGTTCLIAQSGGVSGNLEVVQYGEQVGNCARVDLTAQTSSRYLRVFARPDYSQMKSNSILSLLKAVLSGTYELTIENDYIPGYFFNSTTFDIDFSNTIGISPVYYDAIGGTVISYVGERANVDGVSYAAGVVEYDEQYKPIRKTFITYSALTLDTQTRYIRVQFGYAASSNVKCTLHTGDAFKATITTI